MEKLNLKSKLNFDNTDINAPYTIIKNFADQIKEETNGMIKGAVEVYDGPVDSYTPSSFLSVIQDTLAKPMKKIDIQESLGKQGEALIQYEFYLSTPVFEHYKYRICFIQYGIANYPVKVVLEQNIADEINPQDDINNYVFSCNNWKEFNRLIKKVIFSKKIISIMQELINIYQIHRQDDNLDTLDQSNNQDIPNKGEDIE